MSMRIFDKNGILLIPKARFNTELCKAKQLVVVRESYCPNGHSLMAPRVKFGNYNGIYLKAVGANGEGYISLSPVFGDKTRVSIDLNLVDNEIVKISCAECNTPLPVYGKCECGGELIVAFTTVDADFNNCVGFCNRVGCVHAELKNQGQMLSISAPSSF